MKKFGLISLLLLMVYPLWAAIYTWTDGQGVVHFSDSPHQGATEVNLPAVQTVSIPPPAAADAPAAAKTETSVTADETGAYQIIITQPADQDTIRNNQGYVPVIMSIEPTLKTGDTLQLIFDNKPLGPPQTTTVFALRDIERGTHSVSIQALNSDGEVISTSNNVTFFMHRPKAGGG